MSNPKLTPTKYRKRPVTIEAMHFSETAGDLSRVYLWVEENTLGSFEPMAVIEGREPWPASGITIDPRDGRMVIATLEGGHWVTVGDFVIRGVHGEFYPCKPDIFVATYEGLEEDVPGPGMTTDVCVMCGGIGHTSCGTARA